MLKAGKLGLELMGSTEYCLWIETRPPWSNEYHATGWCKHPSVKVAPGHHQVCGDEKSILRTARLSKPSIWNPSIVNGYRITCWPPRKATDSRRNWSSTSTFSDHICLRLQLWDVLAWLITRLRSPVLLNRPWEKHQGHIDGDVAFPMQVVV